MNYLPSKKFIISALILIAGGWFCYSKFYKGKKSESLASAFRVTLENSLEEVAKRAEGLDADNDGLKDWEEVLWGTDINNSDTDGDTYSDKQEAEQGYDPLDPLSNEKTGKKGSPKEFSVPDISGSFNFTQELAKISGYQVFQAGAEGSQLDISSSLNFLDEDVNKELAQYVASFNPRISERELKISSDNSREAVEKYAKESAEVFPFALYPPEGEENIMTEALQAKNFEKIDKLINFFNQTAINLKKITVPSDFLAVHKRQIELVLASQRVYESIKEIDKDPFKAILGIQQIGKIKEETIYLTSDFLKLYETHI